MYETIFQFNIIQHFNVDIVKNIKVSYSYEGSCYVRK